MLEGLVAWVLNNYLGKYVENLNTDQLSVAMLSGKVELENLPLKKDALRHLGIPVQVKAGFIGKVKLQVPVRQIRSAPWVIVIEKLYVVAAPVNLDEWDSEVEATIEQERKVAILDALEAQWRAENEAHLDSSYYGTSYSSWLSYGTGLLTNIVENLQLKLNDVHIRYEDTITCGERNAFACGLTVESLSAESCDFNWQKGFTLFSCEGEGCSFKLIELQKLAVYWDPVPMPLGLLANYTLGELAVRMSQTWNSNHHYIVSPSTAIAYVKRERCEQPLRSKARPRIDCNLTLDQVLLNLTDRQYNEFVGCLRGLDSIARLKAFRQWRPHSPVGADARAWWKYAIKCHYPEHHWMDPKPTWDSCRERAKKSCEYVAICLSILTNPTATLPPDKKAAKDEFEWNTPLELLKPLREVAIRAVPKVAPAATTPESNTTGRSMLVAWFPQWWGWYGSQPSSQDSETSSYQPATENSAGQSLPNLEEEILDVLADSIENNTLLKRDTVFGHFDFTLNKGCLNLSIVNPDAENDTNPSAMLELQFEKVCLGVESRPRTGSHAVTVALGTVCLRDKITTDTLFPILIAPQGTIREGLSTMNVTSNIMSWYRSHQPASSASLGQPASADPLFQLTYERKPFSGNCDYKLYVKSQSLEVVYNSGSVKWLSEFISHPFAAAAGAPPVPINGAYAHMRDTTKMHLINKWENILQGNLSERSTWQIELDISAPQIMFVEDFTDKNGIVMVVDFGKMHLTNGSIDLEVQKESLTEEDDFEMFMTPCSTPPGSALSPASPLPLDAPQVPPAPAPPPPLDQYSLHRRLYDRYTIELSDLQFLVGRARDNWKYAHTKGTSSLHLLDRFSISLQAERRVVYTSDPQFPSATLCGTLPHLVVHLNEQKLSAVKSILAQITTPTTAPPSSNEDLRVETSHVSPQSDEPTSEYSETERTERSSNQLSKLFMVQFAIDQMALEVQSRGRSIAEVQVCGVRASFTKRPFDCSLALSVHSLLLVDALQTYGPDFELLVASHKHVGMDCSSGSMRDSEPTSPTSPASPDGYALQGLLPPPQALAQALHSLHSTPQKASAAAPNCASPVMPLNVPGLVDSEALIVVEVTVVQANCPSNQEEELRIANILFNNLDIIANQETIVELIGFAQRVFAPKGAKKVPSDNSIRQLEPIASTSLLSISPQNDDQISDVRTEITFDFHRLSVLLLRAAVQEGSLVAKKIATATMSEAKIQATIGNESLEVKGSLGGLQVVSLCPGASVHTRVVSVGQDSLQPPAGGGSARLLSALAQELYRGVSTGSLTSADEKAFVFNIKRTVEHKDYDGGDVVKASVSVHVASVWYTHSSLFIGELQSCVTEFRQYLSNLARSIKAAAADMAIGLVQPRPDSLYANPKLSQSTEGVSPRRPRTTSVGYSLDNDSVADCLKADKIVLSVDIELETPVVVLPRAAGSTEVIVAHLGKMFLANRPQWAHHYDVQVRDISLFSLDIGPRLKTHNISADNMQLIYNAGREGKPVLHNTTLHLSLEHSDALCEDADVYEPTTMVTGKIVTPLRVSATREQFEQLLDTVKTLGMSQVAHRTTESGAESHISTETSTTDSGGVTTLGMDPQLRAQVLSILPPSKVQVATALVNFKVNFQLPSFTVELRGDFGNGERSLVDLSFRDFNVNYEKFHQHETNIQVSLHSITMEDLTQDVESKHRLMMVSHTPHIPKAVFVSKSCPDFITEYPYDEMSSISSLHLLKMKRCSMPNHLNRMDGGNGRSKGAVDCGVTPPCSPYFDEEDPPDDTMNTTSADDNLVLISVQLRDPQHPLFEEKYNRVSKFTKVDFNCLNLVVSIDSWVAVLDFFGIVSDDGSPVDKEEVSVQEEKPAASETDQNTGITETEMSIRSLSVVLLGHRGEVCRANISRLRLQLWSDAALAKRSVEGRLGSMSLTDLTQHGKIWRERFLTSGKEALSFHYKRLSPEEAALAEWDTMLSIDMSTISCVHTKRFVAEVQAFFRDFSLLQRVLVQARQKVSVASKSRSNRMHLSIECRSPLILVPVSSQSRAVLVIDLGRLKVDNSFKISGAPGTISSIRDSTDPVREMLDVRIIQLDNMDLFCGERRNEPLGPKSGAGALPLGPFTHIQKRGPSLLTENCRLVLQMENNMESYHNVPDMTIQGTLDTLECALDPDQYKLVRGLLSYNMGENIDDLNVSEELAATPSVAALAGDDTWTLTSIKLDLLNVTLRLETEHQVSSLACINFIKSRLLVETYSDLSQDIDLVSQEILVSDTRYQSEPANKRSNVFSNIVTPMSDSQLHSVQAEVHARKRRDHSAYTILVNNMRLMAIMDWWEAVNQFILRPPDTDFDTGKPLFMYEARDAGCDKASRQSSSDETQIELKLNITESQVVLVEDTSLWDTNAVILKSTTVISYRPGSESKPVSCVLNHCEVFSCVLGMEDETALSIIDPVTLHIDLDAQNVLQFQVATFNVRLSYHDMRMFAGMLHSLPAQARTAGGGASNSIKPPAIVSTAPANSVYFNDAARRLSALGFSTKDCATALATCSGRMDEAALWLTRNAKAVAFPITPPETKKKSALWPLKALQMRADCITICVIDDCLDSDVPLLELSLSELTVSQDLRVSSLSSSGAPLLVTTPQSPPLLSPETEVANEATERQTGPGGGKLKCLFSGDYYNRGLSGWEPVVEPWRCEASWEYTLTSNLSRNRLQLEINSTEILNINITSTLIDLYSLVKTNWTQDYYAVTPRGESSPKNSPPGYRRRSPFVPFALNNQTGHKLWFTTFVTTSDVINEGEELSEIDDSWIVVRPGETEAFSFGSRRRRGRASVLRLHQVGVRVDGWGAIGPVCVDRVGVFFRHATHTKSDVEARVVFAVTLEGSARKLVTVRSALQLVNDLPQSIEVRIDSGSSSGTWLLQCVYSQMHYSNPILRSLCPYTPVSITSRAFPPIHVDSAQWGLMSSRSVQVGSGQTWSAPLVPAGLPLWVRPLPGGARYPFLYCAQPLDWRAAARRSPTQSPLLVHHVCHSSGDQLYRFCCIVRREKFPIDRGMPMPSHTLILKPSLRIVNLLPVDLHYSVDCNCVGAIAPGATEPFHQVNVENVVEMSFKLDGFANSTLLTILQTATTSFSTKVKMIDTKGRRLYLNAHISIKRTDTIKVSISAPYWIVNKTGLPIVFRQEGIASETAGQYEEHEIARMVAPLLFSFAESEGSPTVVARVGASSPGQSQWCSAFGLGPGTVVRRLVIRGDVRGASERVSLVGVCVRPGRGRYRRTNICTICPRYQLHNNTSYKLQFAQKCLASNLTDPGATPMDATSGCFMAFHWPRPDREQLLCVRPLDVPDCQWSGGFPIDTNNSLHISCRDHYGTYYFLRLEVILQGATFLVVFTDADTMPPAIRLENLSPVSIIFHQASCRDEVIIKPHTSMPWALTEPCGKQTLVLGAPGGSRTSVELHLLSDTHTLTYQNFIYIAFTGTHISSGSMAGSAAATVEDSQLVLEVPVGTNKVILGRKRYGDRSQLWRRGPNHQLIHEGSTPPQASNLSGREEAPLSPHAMVLDIEGPAPRPGTATALSLRRADPRRVSTQAWRLAAPGRMCCAHANLCVQPEDGFFGLRTGNRVVLGLPGPPSPRVTPAGLPLEQAVSWQTLRPGSGFLDVSVQADGPTRVIKIVDAKAPNKGWIDGNTTERNRGRSRPDGEYELRAALGGLGVSLVSRAPAEELVYALFSGILMELASSSRSKSLNLSVQAVQCDNQLLGTTCPVLLHKTAPRGGAAPPALPGVHLSLDLTPSPPTRKYNAVIFKHFIVSFRPISVRLEERLLLKLCTWAGGGLLGGARGAGRGDDSTEAPDETDFETHRILHEVTAVHAKRYYFGVFKIIPSQIRLSVQTTSKLSPELGAVKRHLNLTLIRFEDAGVELEPFVRWHPFETGQFLWHLIIKHFKDELKWQAAKILGSVDFLGNPLGFVQDVSEGVTGLLLEGNVSALVKNVTHGLSNSAAKVTESLGDGLERVILDEAHEETRRRIRSGGGGGGSGGGSGGSHLIAGFRGLGLGILGGVTSLVKHSYEGATQEGIPGFFTGVGKGLVGTVTKPVIGVLDLAAETASAIRETSRRSDKWVPERMRPTRCAAGPGGLLPRYSRTQSVGHQYLYAINRDDYAEGFLAYECVRDSPHDIRALLSTDYLRIFTCKSAAPQVVMETHLSNLVSCAAVTADNCHFVELGVRGGAEGGGGLRRPRVQCDSAALAAWVARQAAYAKRMYHERLHTLHPLHPQAYVN